MSGKLGSILAKHKRYMGKWQPKRIPKTRRVSKKQRKQYELYWQSIERIWEVASKNRKDRKGK